MIIVYDVCVRRDFSIEWKRFFVFQVTNGDTFANLKDWITEMERHCEKTVPKILVGNKDDNDNEVSNKRICRFSKLQREIIKTSRRSSMKSLDWPFDDDLVNRIVANYRQVGRVLDLNGR